jgi:predicted small lipoprotein YifL
MRYRDKKGERAANKALGQRGTTMGSALRVLIAIALILTVGLTACGKRGSLDRPHPTYPETTADPSTKMSQAPNRPLWIDRLLQ